MHACGESQRTSAWDSEEEEEGRKQEKVRN